MTPADRTRIRRVAERLRAMGDETRIVLLLHLRAGDRTVGELATLAGIAQPSASKHLARLKAVGLVQSRRCGSEVCYSVRDPDLDHICSLLCAGVDRFVAEELGS